MIELTTYIQEGFFNNVGDSNAVKTSLQMEKVVNYIKQVFKNPPARDSSGNFKNALISNVIEKDLTRKLVYVKPAKVKITFDYITNIYKNGKWVDETLTVIAESDPNEEFAKWKGTEGNARPFVASNNVMAFILADHILHEIINDSALMLRTFKYEIIN